MADYDIPTPSPQRYPSLLKGLGAMTGGIIGVNKGMGSWTGLNPAVGAPLSGALWGAGLGLAYSGGKKIMSMIRGDEEEKPPTPWWKQPWLVGAGLGTAVGLGSGYLQNHTPSLLEQELEAAQEKGKLASAFASPEQVADVIMRDPSIPAYEKATLIRSALQASPEQCASLLAAAATGMLTAALAHSILGTGFLGSALLGGAAGMIARNLLPGPTVFV